MLFRGRVFPICKVDLVVWIITNNYAVLGTLGKEISKILADLDKFVNGSF